jgi:hypothetical protein
MFKTAQEKTDVTNARKLFVHHVSLGLNSDV